MVGYSHSDDTNFLSWAHLCADQRTPDSQAGAHHRCGKAGLDVFWDGEGEVFVGADMAGVSTLGDGTI